MLPLIGERVQKSSPHLGRSCCWVGAAKLKLEKIGNIFLWIESRYKRYKELQSISILSASSNPSYYWFLQDTTLRGRARSAGYEESFWGKARGWEVREEGGEDEAGVSKYRLVAVKSGIIIIVW